MSAEVSGRNPALVVDWRNQILVLLCLIYVAGALALEPARFLQIAAMYGSKFAIVLPTLLVVGACVASLIYGRASPTKYIIDFFRERLLRAMPVLVLFYLGLSAFTAYKMAIPELVPFYGDVLFADLDLWLHGSDPWRYAWALASSEAVVAFVFRCYEQFWFIQWFGTILFVAFWINKQERLRYLWALALTMCLCGTVLATALSSVGPVFYDRFVGGDRFAELTAMLETNAQLALVTTYAEYLMKSYQAGTADLGTGISAMPSMHVALVTLNAFFLSSLKPWAGVVGWVFAGIILFGSVCTGWHYAVDGYLSILVVSLIWFATGRFFVCFETGKNGAPAETTGRLNILSIPDVDLKDLVAGSGLEPPTPGL